MGTRFALTGQMLDRSRRARLLALLAHTTLALGPLRALATEPSPRVVELQGVARRALATGRVQEACAALALAVDLAPDAANLANLGACHARAGLAAEAYNELRAAAHLTNDARLSRRIDERIATLTPLVARVRIEIQGEGDAPRVVCNGRQQSPLHEQAFAPGDLACRIEHLGRPPEEFTFTLLGGQSRTLTIPVARANSPRAEPPPHAEPKLPVQSPRVTLERPPLRRIGWVMLVVGAATVVAGGATGYLAAARAGVVRQECRDGRCSPRGLEASDQGRLFANLATGTLIGGGISAALGLTFVLVGAGDKVTVAPAVGRDEVGVGFAGAF